VGDDNPLARGENYYRALVSGQARGWWPVLQRGGLWTASLSYGLVVGLRNRLYDRGCLSNHRMPVPVVSVGNLTVGGTGKTPCVEYVAGVYQNLIGQVAILSRGYGSKRAFNDEALVLQENLPGVPHLQGPDRVALARTAVKTLHSAVLVLDDGFQHRRLARDLDVVLVDATAPWGHDYLLPRGLLREKKAGLQRAGVVLLTRCDQVAADQPGRLQEAIARFAPSIPVIQTVHRPRDLINANRDLAPLERLQGRRMAAFCGIGNPDAFRHTLAGLGLTIVAFRTFPDHYSYTQPDVQDLEAWAQQDEDGIVVTTQKDLVKIRRLHLGGKELWALRVQLHLESGRDLFDRKLLEALRYGDRTSPFAPVADRSSFRIAS
jgi:tetraacyldisaccharide 4'-kinase